LLLLTLSSGCWETTSFYTEQATYGPHNYYSEYGVSGDLSKKVSADVFVSPVFVVSDHADSLFKEDYVGGGFRFYWRPWAK
jgi:hypothetical protein